MTLKKIVTSVYDKRNAFNFNIVNYPFLDGNISGRQSYGVHVSQLVRICSIYDTFKCRNLKLTAKLIKQGYKYKLCFFFKNFLQQAQGHHDQI